MEITARGTCSALATVPEWKRASEGFVEPEPETGLLAPPRPAAAESVGVEPRKLSPASHEPPLWVFGSLLCF